MIQILLPKDDSDIITEPEKYPNYNIRTIKCTLTLKNKGTWGKIYEK
jgi:hypothetical protein